MRLKTLAASAALATLAALPLAQAADTIKPDQLAAELQKGGHVLYMRHASTERDYADQVNADPLNCSTQRTLSEAGWNEAERIGTAFDALRIPVGPVYSSQYCRAWQTARIAFSTPVKTDVLNFEPAEDFTPEQMQAMRARVMPLLTQQPPEGFNTIIVGHDDPFEAATGIYPEPQGVMFILKPDGDGGFEILGHVEPQDWQGILAAGS